MRSKRLKRARRRWAGRIPRNKVLRNSKQGMEMVQVAILVAIAIVLGLIFKNEITAFVNKTFEGLNQGF